jgi:hypothetical protein
MRIRALDENNDWCWGLGRQDYRDGAGAMEEDITTRLLCWKHDCFFAMEEGIDWNSFIGGKERDLGQLKKEVTREILAVDGVLTVSNFTMARDSRSRKLRINVAVDTIYGKMAIDESV